jgi:O-succinylhomoserine sulfhydrylase
LSLEIQAEMGITPSTVRLSVGLEHQDDLIRDIETALKAI